MKKILRIARVELSILFYSPIAWLVLIIFIIQCGVTITDLIEVREAKQQLGNQLKSLTTDIYGGYRGFFEKVKDTLYLYLPLLTMGLMSRELSSGSIKLLQSSPVTNKQIILGKFLAMAAYCFLFVLVLSLAVFIGVISVESLDVKYTLGAILGLYFLACAYAAVGLFMSSLTTYQIVAAMSTLALFGLLNFMSSVGQSYDFVRDITYWMALSNRVDNFIAGLISSKDVIYFLLIIITFLKLSIMRLNAKKSTMTLTKKIAKYIAVVFGVLTIGYLSSLPITTKYYDTTRFKTKTLTKNTQNLLKQLKEPVKITVYANVINAFAHLATPKFRIYDLKQFDDYTRFLPNLEINYVPYYNYTLNARDNTDKTLEERAKRAITAYGFNFDDVLEPDEIDKIIDLKSELNGFVRVLEYQNKTSNLHMFFDTTGYPKESEISAAVKNVLQFSPKIGLLTGNDERTIDKRGDKDYKAILNEINGRSSLINQGFTVENISFEEHNELPLDLTVLIIADPIEMYTEKELQKISVYLKNGGNALIAGEPYKEKVLNPILKEIGVEYTQGMLLQESKDYKLNLIQGKITSEAKYLGFNVKKESVISMPSAMNISYKDTLGFTAKKLLVTKNEDVWNQKDRFNLEVDSISFNKEKDKKITATLALSLSRTIENKEQKIIVLGDADVLSNKELQRSNLKNQENYNFSSSIFKWFTNGEYPIDTTRPKPIDNKIKINSDQISWINILFTGVLPVILALIAIILLVKRKRN